MKIKAPQFELSGIEDAFNLASETTIDGERMAREKLQRERDAAAAAKQQRPLFPDS